MTIFGQTVDDSVASLVSGVLAFTASIIAAVLLYISNKKQRNFMHELQTSRNDFEESMQEQRQAFEDSLHTKSLKASEDLERFKTELLKHQALVESDIRKKETAEKLKFQHLYKSVADSRKVINSTIETFRSMVEKSLYAEDPDLLIYFTSSINALNQYSESADILKELIRDHDAKFMSRTEEKFLKILLGMRFEKGRRKDNPEYIERVAEYSDILDRIERAASRKYRLFLQPDSVEYLTSIKTVETDEDP